MKIETGEERDGKSGHVKHHPFQTGFIHGHVAVSVGLIHNLLNIFLPPPTDGLEVGRCFQLSSEIFIPPRLSTSAPPPTLRWEGNLWGKQFLAAEGPHSLIVAVGVWSDTCTMFARPLFPFPTLHCWLEG